MSGDLPGALSKRCDTVGRQIWLPLSKPHHSVNRSAGSQEVRRVPNKRWRHSALWPQWRKLGGNKPQGPPAAPIFPSHSHPDNEFPEELGSATCQRHRPQRMVGLGHGNGRFQSIYVQLRADILPHLYALRLHCSVAVDKYTSLD